MRGIINPFNPTSALRPPGFRLFKEGALGPPYLDGVVSSACCDLDATIADSYGGSGQTWANLIASPADGADQTDYDFFLGADGTSSTDDPTFSTDEFQLDGGDAFVGKVQDVTYLRNAFRTDISNPVTFIMAFNTPQSFQYFFNMGGGSDDNTWSIRINADGTLFYFGRNGGSNEGTTLSGAGAVPDATDTLLILSFDINAGSGKYWVNSRTGTNMSGVPTGNAGAVDAGHAPVVAAFDSNNLASQMVSGAKVYSWAFLNEAIDDTKAADIIDHLNDRHGRTYA